MGVRVIQFNHVNRMLLDHPDYQLFQNRSLFRTNNGYAVVKAGGTLAYVHRLIMQAPRGRQVDHINGDRLDNRRSNLRLVSGSQNQLNRVKPSYARSGYRGVHTHHNRADWQVKVERNHRTLCFGSGYRSCHVAALVYEPRLRAIVGPRCRTNFAGYIKSSKLGQVIDATKGRLFRVVFSRRSDGRQRVMTCRVGVSKDLKGKAMAFAPPDKNLSVVYDVHKRGYRCIPLDRVLCLRIARRNYAVA